MTTKMRAYLRDAASSFIQNDLTNVLDFSTASIWRRFGTWQIDSKNHDAEVDDSSSLF